jgi:hypothetical protein
MYSRNVRFESRQGQPSDAFDFIGVATVQSVSSQISGRFLGRCVKLAIHLQLVPRSRKRGPIHPLPHTSSWQYLQLRIHESFHVQTRTMNQTRISRGQRSSHSSACWLEGGTAPANHCLYFTQRSSDGEVAAPSRRKYACRTGRRFKCRKLFELRLAPSVPTMVSALHAAELLMRSWKSLSWPSNTLPTAEPESPLPCWQERCGRRKVSQEH